MGGAFAARECGRQRFSEAPGLVFSAFCSCKGGGGGGGGARGNSAGGADGTHRRRSDSPGHSLHLQSEAFRSFRQRRAARRAAAANTASQALSEAPPPGHHPNRHQSLVDPLHQLLLSQPFRPFTSGCERSERAIPTPPSGWDGGGGGGGGQIAPEGPGHMQ